MGDVPNTAATNEPGADASPFSAPNIDLPKGGGAIRGIGEKFTANAATGTGTLTVPIALSPGRSGFGPQLSLSYDSGTGNGVFGIGWTIDSPAITRKTDKGIPNYDEYDRAESGVFILSKNEDLVPSLMMGDGGHWVDDEFCRGEFTIKRYRPRIEGLFASIERWICQTNGDVHWRSISKDNILTVYGRTANSRVADPHHPRHIFSWHICESYDAKGNAIIYEYIAENDEGVNLSKASEQRRIRGANRYLKRIRYGNRIPLMVDQAAPGFRTSHVNLPDFEKSEWMFEADFDYGDVDYYQHPPDSRDNIWVNCNPSTQLDRPWPNRADPFSSYRSGFEVRTHRLCRRVLMLHHFPEELGTADCLVRSTEFAYREKPIGSFITRIVQSGYTRHADGRYLTKSMPPLLLDYTSSPLEKADYHGGIVREVDCLSVENLPSGIDGSNYKWVDLDGEGIPGVLTEQFNAWFYKPNAGNGRLAALQVERRQPSIANLTGGKQQLLDVAGDGLLDLVQFDSPTPGFFNRTIDAGWERFRAFPSLPIVNWSDPNLRFVDITGDGIADVLITEDDAFTWHESMLDEGYGRAIRVTVPTDERAGPHVIFADGTQSLYLADMTGDGLSDLVRIRNGEICYWPNLGYGRFGARVTMDHAPWFENNDLFDQSRVRLADTDGSGTSDIIYLASEGIRIYLNELGNSWSDARILRQFASITELSSLTVVDFLGRGTACLLWSSSAPADTRRPLRYMDLIDGQKPHLLIDVQNNLGARTHMKYASSTEFYLADKAAGSPWVTRLPFPVHVVTQVETFDYVSRSRFVSSYTYHHGFFDGLEREFRGFGRVDQVDTARFDSTASLFQPGLNEDEAFSVPPVLTKTWYHTGLFLANGRVSRHLAHEYYREPVPDGAEAIAAMSLDDTILPGDLSPEEAREACRALKGSTLRQEIYALDGTAEADRPYTVTESNSTIAVLQPRLDNLHAVFFAHPREAVTLQYERKLYDNHGTLRADPRVSHSLTLQVDRFGNVLRSASIGYGRRFTADEPELSAADRIKQKQILITYTENAFTNSVELDESHRVPVIAEARTFELINLLPVSNCAHATNLFRFNELAWNIDHASDGRHDLPYEDFNAVGAELGTPYRRLIDESRSYYRADRLDRILPLRVVESLALPGQSFKVAFTPGLLADVYRKSDYGESLLPEIDRVLKHEGRYVKFDEDPRWWIGAGRIYYAQHECSGESEFQQAHRHFYIPRRFVDPFGNTSVVTYDPHDLLPVQVRDAVGNTISSEIDYRVLSPWRTTDANRNRSQVSFDTLGMVVGTAIMGKPGQRAGDSLDGFEPDFDLSVLLECLAHPLDHPHKILRLATTRLVYDLFAYDRTRNDPQPSPAVVYTLARETHAADLQQGELTRYQHSFSYSDGFGREVQKKLQAEPGPVVDGGPKVESRWVGSGWTIFNNKGKPVRQYEPFFTEHHSFEFAHTVGVSSILFYDPAMRVVATLHPNHTWEKVVFDPWRQESWDVNDTSLQPNPPDDPNVGDYFVRLPEQDYLPTWHAQRIEGQLGKEQQQAAINTAVHANTPSAAHFDSLGRTFITIAHNRLERAGVLVDELFATRTELDIENNQRAVIDALGRVAMRYDYDMLGTKLRQVSIDAGTRWMLNDAVGKPLLSWDSRNHRLRREYDALHRPTNLRVRIGDADEFLAERIVYGEGQPNDQTHNLRGQPFQQFDAVGIVTSDRYDFKGNLLKSTRQLLEEYKNDVDWVGSPELEETVYTNSKTYDALNRPITITTPDASVAKPKYNEANLLESLSVNLRGAAEPTPFVTYVNYNAKGQRDIIEYGNGAHTRYSYDPLTFRLTHLLTIRKHDHTRLQDLHYAFDPVGNITSIRDDAQETVYFKNQVVSASNEYIYDATYRLTWANGREHAGKPGMPQTDWDDSPQMHNPLPSDGHALHRYHEQYDYDAVGNILGLHHHAPGGNWSRHYTYDEGHHHPRNNRLTSTLVGQNVEPYSYDNDGNMTRMPHLSKMEWDFKDQLHATRRRESNDGRGETTYYLYDSAGQRVRKVTEMASGSRRDERLYLNGFEVYRKYDRVAAITAERETLNIMGDKQCTAMVDSRTIGEDGSTARLIRYQLDNHLGSVCVELNDLCNVISYEEFTPYGTSAYQSHNTAIHASAKRYRFTGKERDEETAMYYHGARYYAPWLGRWTSSDQAGLAGGINLYCYCSDNPVSFTDCNGNAPDAPETIVRRLESLSTERSQVNFQLEQANERFAKASDTLMEAIASNKANGKDGILDYFSDERAFQRDSEKHVSDLQDSMKSSTKRLGQIDQSIAQSKNELMGHGLEWYAKGLDATGEKPAADEIRRDLIGTPEESFDQRLAESMKNSGKKPPGGGSPPAAPGGGEPPAGASGGGGGSAGAAAGEAGGVTSFMSGLAHIGLGVGVNYVSTQIAMKIIEGSKFNQEQATLNQANHAAESPDDKRIRETGAEVLGTDVAPFNPFLSAGLRIAGAVLGRVGTDTFYDMVQGQRNSEAKTFDSQNPDAPEGAQDRMQKQVNQFEGWQ